MKKTILLQLLLCSLGQMQAQKGGELYGYVYEQNSGKKPVPGVLVKAFLANQTSSNNQGSYTLNFQGAKPGFTVSLSVQKDTWLVTSKNGLEVSLPEDPLQHPHTLIMCREAVWKQQSTTNRAILEKYLQQSYQQKLAGLNRQNKNYQKTLDSLQDLYTQQEREMGDFTDAMSRINLDDVSAKEQEAYRLFQEGNIEACKKLRESLKSEENFLKNKQRQKQLDSVKQVVSTVRNETNEAASLHRRNLREEAQLAQLQLNFTKADEKLAFLATNDSTDFESLFAYAVFLRSQHQYKKAIVWAEKARAAATNMLDKNRALLLLADTHGLNFDNEQAKTAFQSALTTATTLARQNPAAYQPHAGKALMLAGLFYRRIHMDESAQTTLQQALEILQPLAANNPATYRNDMLTLQNAQALILFRKINYKAAEQAFVALMNMIKNNEAEAPEMYRVLAAGINQNLGMLYYRTNQFLAARQYFLEALATRKKLQQDNPARYNQQVVQTLVTLADLYSAMDNVDSAKYYFEEAIRENHTITDAALYKDYQDADLEIRLLQLQADATDNRKEKVNLLQAIVSKRKTLVKDYKDKYTDQLADELGNYSWQLLLDKQYPAAEQAAREGLQLVLPKELQQSKNTEWLNACLAPALLLQGKYEEAEKIYTALKDKSDVLKKDGTPYKVGFLNDLDEIEKAGIQHSDIAKIRTLLNQP